ncbi:hypothetical protein P3T76_010691 [Phytophthora citrophthora]|uniref:BZIP domain-containing protein n=1 Tax=Phytophthora citrophthora TaxID=4793 RepID=A0AAD9LGI5_9STRA|nr:hypothetical protein P3T76_010691 [Phytophthora citrophthora]
MDDKSLPRPNRYEATIREILIEKERRRTLRRERQIRYRKKKNEYLLGLEDRNKLLREEIKKFEERRRILCTVVPVKHTIWSVAVEYFRLFRYGGDVNAHERQSNVQWDFLRVTMAPDVIFNSEQGVGVILRHWQQLSTWFSAIEVDLENLERRGEDSVTAVTRTDITISELTLSDVFPHLRGCYQTRLASQLVGRRFTLEGFAYFEWDHDRQCVSSVIAQSDMITPILRLLSDLEDVSWVFEMARISPDFRVKADSGNGYS